MKWIQQVEKLNLAELETPSARWDDLDTALADAVVNVAKGALGRELLLYREEKSRLGKALSGRAALWHPYQRFKLDHGMALSIDLSTLVQLSFGGDFEGFLVAWDHCFMALRQSREA